MNIGTNPFLPHDRIHAVLSCPDFPAQAIMAQYQDHLGKPFVVLEQMSGSLKTAICSRSPRAREMGIEPGMEIGELDPELLKRVAVRNRNKAQEHLVQQDMAHVIGNATPACCLMQGGDAWLNLTGTPVFRELGIDAAMQKLCADVRSKTGIQEVAAGVSRQKVLSFVLAKRAYPNGVVICPRGHEDEWLRASPIALLPGIRPQVLKQIERWNPKSVFDLLALSRADLKKRLGREGDLIYGLVRGHLLRAHRSDACEPVVSEIVLKRDINDLAELKKCIRRGLDMLFHEAIRRNLVVGSVRISIVYGDGKRDGTSVDFSEKINCSDGVSGRIIDAFLGIYTRRVAIRSVAFHGMKIGTNTGQLSFLAPLKTDSMARKNAAVKAIRNRLGFESIQRASYFKAV